MAVDDIIDDLESVLSSGTWSNYHSSTPSIFDDDVKDYYKINKEGIWLTKSIAKAITAGNGSIIFEKQQCYVYCWSNTSVSTRDNLVDDIKAILDGTQYVLTDIERYKKLRKNVGRIKIQRVEV